MQTWFLSGVGAGQFVQRWLLGTTLLAALASPVGFASGRRDRARFDVLLVWGQRKAAHQNCRGGMRWNDQGHRTLPHASTTQNGKSAGHRLTKLTAIDSSVDQQWPHGHHEPQLDWHLQSPRLSWQLAAAGREKQNQWG